MRSDPFSLLIEFRSPICSGPRSPGPRRPCPWWSPISTSSCSPSQNSQIEQIPDLSPCCLRRCGRLRTWIQGRTGCWSGPPRKETPKSYHQRTRCPPNTQQRRTLRPRVLSSPHGSPWGKRRAWSSFLLFLHFRFPAFLGRLWKAFGWGADLVGATQASCRCLRAALRVRTRRVWAGHGSLGRAPWESLWSQLLSSSSSWSLLPRPLHFF